MSGGRAAEPLDFLLLGEQSLLVRCAERLLGNGHRIRGIVTEDRRIREWAGRLELACFARYEALRPDPPAGGFDYLLSITNLRILPAWLLRMPRRGAVNFHDGPLPRYAGLNAPVWALLAGEREYGVAWHELVEGVDRGRLLAGARFDVAPDATAFGINAQCYEAGYESFTALLSDIEAGRLQPKEQDPRERSYFGLDRRPARAACLDWQQTAGEAARTVRALDFGRYPNPVLLPKIDLGGSLLLVREAAPADSPPGHGVPGQLLRTGSGEMAVRCADGALVLRRLSDTAGRALEPATALAAAGFREGAVLPGPVLPPGLDGWMQRLARHEGWWLRQFRGVEFTTAPFARRRSDPSGKPATLDVPVSGPDGDTMVAVLGLLLARLSGRRDIDLACIPRELATIEAGVSRFIGPRALLSARFDPAEPFAAWKAELSAQLQRCGQRVGWSADLPARQPELAAAFAALDIAPVALLRVARVDEAEPWLAEHGSRHALAAVIADDGACRLVSREGALEEGSLARLGAQLSALAARVADGTPLCGDVSILAPDDVGQLQRWCGRIEAAGAPAPRIHEQFESQVAREPSRRACVFADRAVTYAELNRAANRIARELRSHGIGRGDRVGIRIPRGIEMVAAMLGVLKSGAAYVPLDPTWPEDRLALMSGDAGLARVLGLEEAHAAMQSDAPGDDLLLAGEPSDLAYLIYTSGSTGRPKGVMVEHRQVANFFAGIDERFGTGPGTWLAVTSISFDISVLELLWTLARGFTVVLHGDALRLKGRVAVPQPKPASGPAFGLFYWNVAKSDADHDEDKYRLLLESARFADTHGFNAVWTPERHFESFGGLFPNPSVTSAALATITNNAQLRAGSCVVPLHSPIRIAEEWAVVDNLSNGRVGISVASGWAMPDFAIRPENFANAKQVMFESTEILRRLWRGETVAFPGPKGEVKVRTLPRPVQKELPVWVTTAGNPETWVQAGRTGANVLTHLLGQSVEEVADKVAAYRRAWADAGHPGRGIVTLMLHTLVGTDNELVERVVHQPMKDYLRSAVALVKAAAWQFPTFRKLSEEQGRTLDEFFAGASEQDMDDLLEFAFQRYFHESGLFGTPQRCLGMVERVTAADIDEIACLIDFGIATDTVLAHLPHLDALRRLVQGEAGAAADVADRDHSLAQLLRSQGITHLQCTPTMATMLAGDPDAREGLAGLRELMVGGEALTPDLARSLATIVRGRISNMYGPTETTVWSTVGTVDANAVTSSNGISIGTQLKNQSVHILDERQQPLPPGIVGEIVIGGAGVTRGYWNQPEMTASRFVGQPPMYRTGDLGRFLPDGRIECLGRSDQQVKIRGHRVELGEIEAVLREQAGIAEAAVVLREFSPGDHRLAAFVRTASGVEVDVQGLRQSLGRRLPDYMVPTSVTILQALPLTPNGKVDRKSLAAASRSAAGMPLPSKVKSPALPPGNAEQLVLDIWRRALGVEEIGLRDNFFDIGGHSLLVVQVLKELREKAGRPIQMTDLFRYTTVEALARFLGEGPPAAPAVATGRDRANARRLARTRN
jgi:natural product biosynthesis luciferase-like monooxygenase protein